jgi:hypothetical protein
VTLLLDAGALIAIERADRGVMSHIKRQWLSGQRPRTHGGVVGQVWRSGSGRQALLARTLAGVEIAPLDEELGKRAGALLAEAGTRDVIDAAVVLLARDNDLILTSDPDELRPLAVVSGTHMEIIAV